MQDSIRKNASLANILTFYVQNFKIIIWLLIY